MHEHIGKLYVYIGSTKNFLNNCILSYSYFVSAGFRKEEYFKTNKKEKLCLMKIEEKRESMYF